MHSRHADASPRGHHPLQPTFRRKATEEERRQIQGYIKKYNALWPLEADHYLVFDPFGDMGKVDPSQWWKVFWKTQRDLKDGHVDFLKRELSRKKRVVAYALIKKYNFDAILPKERIGLDMLFLKFSRWIFTNRMSEWLREHLQKRLAAKNLDNPAVQLFDKEIPGVGTLRQYHLIRPKR